MGALPARVRAQGPPLRSDVFEIRLMLTPAVCVLGEEAVRLLTTELRPEVPEQDLSIGVARMPAIPTSRFVIADVAPAG